MINARSETASIKPAFRDALKSRRCLIPADGFYEWMRTGKAKQPYCFVVGEGKLFAFAGIWDRWKDPSGNTVETCSILTTTPNAVTAPVHNRMPVILDADSYELWLDSGMRDVGAASELLRPCDAQMMRCYPVSTRINRVANDDAECSRRVELVQLQPHLFSLKFERGAYDEDCCGLPASLWAATTREFDSQVGRWAENVLDIISPALPCSKALHHCQRTKTRQPQRCSATVALLRQMRRVSSY